MQQRISFYVRRLKERLWVKPLISCAMSICAIFLARTSDYYFPDLSVMDISVDTLKTLLSIISASMLGMAVFAVGSMLSAYSSVSTTATPHAFDIVITDDVSQYALSVFVGAFIFSIIGLIALMNGLYQDTGRFVIFVLTILVFAIVILGFVRWVDNIARLGTLGKTISKVEDVTKIALLRYETMMTQIAQFRLDRNLATPIFANQIGYLQQVNMDRLQETAQHNQFRIEINKSVGSLLLPNEPLAFVQHDNKADISDETKSLILKDFIIGHCRTFDEDPRYGVIVLSEIASRALSPAVNDPGTAIDILSVHARLLTGWSSLNCSELMDTNHADSESPDSESQSQLFDRVVTPSLSADDLFDDAFKPIARDGSAHLEVMIRLQKVLLSLSLNNKEFKPCTIRQREMAMRYAKANLLVKDEYAQLEQFNSYEG